MKFFRLDYKQELKSFFIKISWKGELFVKCHFSAVFRWYVKKIPFQRGTTINSWIAEQIFVSIALLYNKVATHSRKRENTGGLKISEFYFLIEDLPESITPQRLVDATLAIAGINHPKVINESTDCNPDVFVDFVSWLDQAFPRSGIGKISKN